MDGPVRAPGPPGFARRGFVGGVVVHDDMDIPILGAGPGDRLEDIEELPGPGAVPALADDRAPGARSSAAHSEWGPLRLASWVRRAAIPGSIGRTGWGRARAWI